MKLSSTPSKILICALLGTACCYSFNAVADAIIVFEEKGPQQSTQNVMLLKDGKVRFSPSDQAQAYSIYNSQNNTMMHIEPLQKQYLEMDQKGIKKQAKQAKQQMDMMRKEMEKRLEKLPPEQRKQAEQMMGIHLASKEDKKNQPKVKQLKTSRTDTIAGIKCDVYESTVNEKKLSESCITTIDQLGLDKQDLKSLEKMQEFMKEMQQTVTDITGNADMSSEIEGLPLHSKLFAQDGSTALETRLITISKEAVAAKYLAVPEGFNPVQLPQTPQIPE